jgi:hypothetical protein
MLSKTTEKRHDVSKQSPKTLVFDSDSPLRRELGICSTCNHRSSCLFLKTARHPIAFCEEFDDSTSQAVSPEPPRKEKRLSEINYGQGQEEGVCVTCANRSSCVYRQPGVAIWDCEDFS